MTDTLEVRYGWGMGAALLSCRYFMLLLLSIRVGLAQNPAAPPPTDASPLFTMEYLVSGRLGLDMRRQVKTPAKAIPRRIFKEYSESLGISYPPGAMAIYFAAQNRIIVRNTRANLMLLDQLIAQRNQANGVNPRINRTFAEVHPEAANLPAESPPTAAAAEPSASVQAVVEAPAQPTPKGESDDPKFNGIPIWEILRNAVVARERSPVYEIQGGDEAFRAARDGTNDQKGVREGDQWEVFLARHRALQPLAQGASPGKLLGYVRAGFLFASLKWKSTDAAAVAFPKELGGHQFGFVLNQNFAAAGEDSERKWWNEDTAAALSKLPEVSPSTRFAAYPLTAKTLLLDPFTASEFILSNTDGAMRAAWVPSAHRFKRGYARHGGVLAVVETGGGLFLGYLLEKGESESSANTWEQTVAVTDQPFLLSRKKSEDLKPGGLILTLFDEGAAKSARPASINPEDFRLDPRLGSHILKRGDWALKSSLAVPKEDGFEPPAELETQTSFQLEIQKKLRTIELRFDGFEADKLRLLIVSEYEVREVQRTRLSNGAEQIEATRWKKKKEERAAEVGLSGDGSALFTEGEKVRQVAPGRMGKAVMTTYHIERNALKR